MGTIAPTISIHLLGLSFLFFSSFFFSVLAIHDILSLPGSLEFRHEVEVENGVGAADADTLR